MGFQSDTILYEEIDKNKLKGIVQGIAFNEHCFLDSRASQKDFDSRCLVALLHIKMV